MSNVPAIIELSRVFNAARHASGSRQHIAPGFDEPHHVTRIAPVGSGAFNLREMTVEPKASSSASTAKHITHGTIPVIPVASKSITLGAAVIGDSLVARAGASIIVAAERNVANTNTIPVMYRDAGLYRVVEPAKFGNVVDGADSDISDAPWSDAHIVWPTAPSIAFRAIFSRASLKGLGGDLLEENFLQSIITGLAEAADRALLAAIVASNPAPFTLAAAATRGLRFENLRALVGTDGTGAAVSSVGVLRADGVSAELTRTTAKTIIGSFDKAAVAIHPDVTVHIERMSVNGEMGCVVFANMLPLLPDASASAFWLLEEPTP